MKYLSAIFIIIAIFNARVTGEDITFSDIKLKYDKIKTIQGNFTQNLCSADEGTCQQFEGKFYIKKPYFSRLEVTNPEKQLIVTDTSNLYIYLTDKKKLYIQSANAIMNFFQIFDLLLNDTSKFVLSGNDKNYYVFTLKKDSLAEDLYSFDDMKFTINNKTNLIERFSYTDLNGQETEFELSKMKINEKLSPKLFKFVMPKGIEVIQ
jgi:chaperone LolA